MDALGLQLLVEEAAPPNDANSQHFRAVIHGGHRYLTLGEISRVCSPTDTALHQRWREVPIQVAHRKAGNMGSLQVTSRRL